MHLKIAVVQGAADLMSLHRWLMMMKLDTRSLGRALWCSRELGYLHVADGNEGRKCANHGWYALGEMISL